MSTLVIERLKTTLSQSFTYTDNKRHTIKAIVPRLVMFNAPAGTFTFSIKSGVTTLASKTFTSAEIKSDLSTSDNYAWLWKVIDFSGIVQLESGTYSLEISSSGYTFTESSYLGWIRDHDDPFNTGDGNNSFFSENPFGFRIYELKRAGA